MMDKKVVEVTKETKYCKLINSFKLKKDDLGHQYAIEKIFVKELQREEVRMCLYKDMRDRSGSINSRMLARPVDLTEPELLQLLLIGIQNELFSNDFVVKLKKLGDK